MTKPKKSESPTVTQASIEHACTVGKSLSVKREKVGDDDLLVAHLKFSGLTIDRDVIDFLAGAKRNWCDALFDELGAPIAALTLGFPGLELMLGGTLAGNAETDERLSFGTSAKLRGIAIDLVPLGAKLSGEITWNAAGDEVTDAEPLLGLLCMARLVLIREPQGDLLKDAA